MKQTAQKQLTYNKLHGFKVYNFIDFDVCIYLGNCYLSQDNEQILHPKNFTVPLGSPSFLSLSLDNHHDYRLLGISSILCKWNNLCFFF